LAGTSPAAMWLHRPIHWLNKGNPIRRLQHLKFSRNAVPMVAMANAGSQRSYIRGWNCLQAVRKSLRRTSHYKHDARASELCNGWIHLLAWRACESAILGSSLKQVAKSAVTRSKILEDVWPRPVVSPAETLHEFRYVISSNANRRYSADFRAKSGLMVTAQAERCSTSVQISTTCLQFLQLLKPVLRVKLKILIT